MKECNLLYKKGNKAPIQRGLKAYLRGAWTSLMFLNQFKFQNISQDTRYTYTTLDESNEIEKSLKDFIDDFEETLVRLLFIHPSKKAKLEQIKLDVYLKLHIQLDKSQVSLLFNESDLEAKNTEEVIDINTKNLDKHLADIYGVESYDIIKTLKESFDDSTTGAAYWNIKSGKVVIRSNHYLNKNFRNIKNEHFAKIVRYLKEKGVLSEEYLEYMFLEDEVLLEYFDVMNKFYRYIKSLPDFKETINANHSEIIKGYNRSKNDMYAALVQTLFKNVDFKKRIKNKYNSNKFQLFQTILYQADHFSEFYVEIKNQLDKDFLELLEVKVNDEETVADIINQIESDELNLLEVTNSYTILTHFDELLEDLHGSSFAIKPGTKGFETDGDKYAFSTDHDHLKKSWQLSENIATEKYIANMTKRILNQIRIYDHKNQVYKNRRVDSTLFIVATRNLLNDLIYGNILWNTKPDVDFINNVFLLHDSPEVRLLKILEYLFDTVNGNRKPYYQEISRKSLLSDYDLDVLYSTYEYIFNKNNPNSLISQELNSLGKEGNVQNLIQEISGFVDRNVTMDYSEVSYDLETGEIIVKKKKKFFNDLRLYKTRVIMNDYMNSRKVLNLYNYNSMKDTGGTNHSVTIGGTTFNLFVPNAVFGQILENNDSIKLSSYPKDVFETLNEIDLTKFRGKIIHNISLDPKEVLLKDILNFLDDTLDLKILKNPLFGIQQLEIYKSIYTPVKNKVVGNHYLMPLILLGIRSTYIAKQRTDMKISGETSLKHYLLSKSDPLFSKHSENAKSKLFSEKFGEIKYRATTFSDEVLNQWIDAYSMLSSESSKATTKDRQGNSIPNNSVNKLGTMLHYYVEKLKGSNVDSLFLTLNQHLLKGTLHDLEVTTWNQDTKSVKDFSTGELFFHSIFNKFWGNYLNSGNVIIQPTTYSDKTTFLLYILNTKFSSDNKDILKSNIYLSEIINQYINTIGVSYLRIWETTKSKLIKIADLYNKINSTELSYRKVLQQLSESELLQLGKLAGVDLMLDHDYRKVKIGEKNVTSVNEELEYYATRLYANYDTLNKALENEKINFVQNLIDANSSFQVLDFGDKYYYYYEKERTKIDPKASSKNSIMYAIQKYFDGNYKGLLNYFKEWVDEKTGKLIIAKLNGNNILGIGDSFNTSDQVVLNPLLDKYFYVAGFLSNNVRMHLTGSETNHPNKAGKTLFDLVKEAESSKDFNDLDVIKVNSELFTKVLNVLNEVNVVGDLNTEYIESLPEDVKPIILDIYDKSLLLISNVSLGTQFKRNVIIPATLQYCQQGLKNGIPNKVKAAVIRDEQAHVYNYRGDYEKDIDASDGSAQITPFQSILENRSLGSLAVGFIKKPIWHSYDNETGTSFLAKFATDTITNEAMRMSLQSHTSLYNLFKKMTNLQWEGDINLMLSILYGKYVDKSTRFYNASKAEKHFLVAILGNSVDSDSYIKENHLLYKDVYGDIIEITGFNKIVLDGMEIYYTNERTYNKNADSLGLTSSTKVYHLFYDEFNPDTNTTEKSKHITFTDLNQLQAFKETKNSNITKIRTINSLFELHTALGGINCVDEEGNYSEFVNEVVVNFMNDVGSLKDGHSNKEIISLDSYELPLKKYQIAYALNNTAVKNGAKNVNQASAWYDDSDLTYFEVDTDGLGMQMNADHDIINSELTEFSLVIAATSAYGYTYDNTNEIFQGLAKAAIQSSKKAITAIDNFLKANVEDPNELNEALSKLYDVIGRIIMVNLSIKDKENLLKLIWEGILEVFYKSKDHNKDIAKIPFSDNNVYGDFISTLASTITSASIKRKHPGSGCVMVPAYNMILYFEIDNLKLMIDDVLKLALTDYKEDLLKLVKQHESATDKFIEYEGLRYYYNTVNVKELEHLIDSLQLKNTSEYYIPGDTTYKSLHLISTYLYKKLLTAKTYNDRSWFMPSDIVEIIDESGKHLKNCVLDSLDSYYKFKDGLIDTELYYGVKIKPDYKKASYDILLNSEQVQLKALVDENNKITDIYEIISFSSKPVSLQLINAAIATLPEGATVVLSEATYLLINLDLPDILKKSSELRSTDNGVFVYNYKKVKQPSFNFKYRVNTTLGRNLRPSLIRWLYLDNNLPVYMNIFDSPVIKNAYIKPYDKSTNYRTLIQDELHRISEKGQFTKLDGQPGFILDNTLENSAAELVVSNMYKDVFGIENESLLDILNLGEDYFYNKFKSLNSPANLIYDFAFLKDDGNHTLITLGNVKVGDYTKEQEFETNELYTNDNGEIYYTKGGLDLFKVGKWVKANGVTYDGTNFIQNGKIINGNFRLEDPEDFTKVQKRIDFVKRFLVVTLQQNARTKKIIYKTNTLYQISKLSEFESAFVDENKDSKTLEKDAAKQRSSIINKIYNTDSYKLIKINQYKTFNTNLFNTINSSLNFILNNLYLDLDVKDLLLSQMDSLEVVDSESSKEELIKLRQANIKKYKELEKEFFKKQAHKKWISFLNSLNFISSRIPAQTLLSFMSMKQIAWTNNNMNMAYVSHFQTYLQGSDYDIDKAYIMGQSYDDNGIYILWSNLFDYTSNATLQASKELPIPKLVLIEYSKNGVNVESLINNLSKYLIKEGSEFVFKFDSELDRIQMLKTISELIKTAETNKGEIYYSNENSEKFLEILNILNKHEFYKVPQNLAEKAYKNVASANIYNVVHDIRNRDQAYTAISMDILLRSAENSPKGNLSKRLNMLNPLTKYVMQRQNLVGKQVIGIAANGEKMWFNAFYYWTSVLKTGDSEKIANLRFLHTFNRIKNRALYNNKKKNQENTTDVIESETVNKIPDLNTRDESIKEALIKEFGIIDPKSEEYKYVDLLISQLLSAATDNAKELILEKINSGTSFAKMYVYAIMTGFNIDDIVAFMTSPIAEFINSMSEVNIFQDEYTNNNAKTAISLAGGYINSKRFLHGTMNVYTMDETGGESTKPINKRSAVKNLLETFILEDPELYELVMLDQPETEDGVKEDFNSLDSLMQSLIKVAVYNNRYNKNGFKEINLRSILNESDTEVNSYLAYCQDIVDKLRNVYLKYDLKEEMEADISEFNKLFNLATEISQISSAWLGLNQGLPTDKLSILTRLANMSKIVYEREKILKIYDNQLFEDSKIISVDISEDSNFETIEEQIKRKKKINVSKNKSELIGRLLENNPTITNVEERLNKAHELGLINNFDIIKYLRDDDYKKAAKDYYGLIMGTFNVFDMMDNLPHYLAILQCLNLLVISDLLLSNKSRLINQLLLAHSGETVTEKMLKGMIEYSDKYTAIQFTQSLSHIVLNEPISGFDKYFRSIDNIDVINLGELSGIATFKHWVEHEFKSWLDENYRENGAVKHLEILPDKDDKTLLTMDIDLLNPNTDSVTRQAYNDILSGMILLEQTPYNDLYTIADILLLYNIIVNNNKYGDERLTTTFKVCKSPKNIINLYFNFEGKNDFNFNKSNLYDYIDYLLISAPIISPSRERFSTEKIIKVKDPVRGYIVKIKKSNGEYKEYTKMIPPVIGIENYQEKLKRFLNFYMWCPFEMPNSYNIRFKINSIAFSEKSYNDMSEQDRIDLKTDILNLLKNYSTSSKLKIKKYC